ncbi:hypothetical protein NL108_006952 [Boleophthalmus pectinirostris]|nr:hypothetical protein NL108_006952 [Boleophthalmus pectinirostris]
MAKAHSSDLHVITKRQMYTNVLLIIRKLLMNSVSLKQSTSPLTTLGYVSTSTRSFKQTGPQNTTAKNLIFLLLNLLLKTNKLFMFWLRYERNFKISRCSMLVSMFG